MGKGGEVGLRKGEGSVSMFLEFAVSLLISSTHRGISFFKHLLESS